MPISASRILKLDTSSNGDNLSLVEDSELPLCKCAGSVLGGDGCVYGLPYKSSPVFKFDPAKILIMNMGCLAFIFLPMTTIESSNLILSLKKYLL